MPNRMKIFSGNANRKMAEEICTYLGEPLSNAEVKKFSDGEISVEIGENVRARMCSLCSPPLPRSTII
jgi:ribose-phosphate pyrophosphokinase